MERLTVSIGGTLAATIQLRDEAGESLTGVYVGTEPLALALWTGEDQAAVSLTGSTVAWQEPAAGTVRLRLDQADSAALVEGAYRLRVRLTDGPDLLDAWEAWLEVTASPGTATVPPTYCTAKEVKDQLSGWIGQLQDESDLTGFADARGEAREEFDRLIQRHYSGTHTSRQTTLDHLLDGDTRSYRSGRDDAALQTALDADGLILTGPTGQAIRRWNALWAASLILDRQLAQGPTSTYQTHAARLRRRCEDLAACLCIEVDTNDDGAGDLTVDLAVIDCLRS